MKTGAIGAVAFAAAIASSATLAADIGGGPFLTAPAPYGGYSWLGPYIGANLGYQFGRATHSGGAYPNGIEGGIQGGYNWQSGAFVFGGEADLQLSGANDTFAAYKFSNPWFGTVRGRAGYALNNILFYGTLGLAYGRGRIAIPGLAEDRLHGGWTAGAGIEVGFAPNWSARAEYLFVDLTDEQYVLTGTSNGFESSVLRFGLNYRF